MGLRIISADERLSQASTTKVQLWGESGIGKTSQARTLDAATTLVGDAEAGTKALEGWGGRIIPLRTWPDCRDLVCWAGGPNPASRPEENYSQRHHEYVLEQYGEFPKDVNTLFLDSTTDITRMCLHWCKGQPEAFSEKTGKADNRGAYGLLAQQFIAWARQLQFMDRLSIVLVGGLEQKTDDFNRLLWRPMVEGAKSQDAIPYIFDQVVTMTMLKDDEGTPYRAFVCHKVNPWSYPAKDRSGRLEMVEEPHLGKLLTKLNTGPRIDAMTYTMPAQEEIPA